MSRPHPGCDCTRCLARREELAGRHTALREARPKHWRPRPGTAKAIAAAYPDTKKRSA